MTCQISCLNGSSLFLLIIFVNLSSSINNLPTIESYAKVSINRPQSGTQIDRNPTYRPAVNQGRGFSDIEISRSPVYVPTGKKLRNGEAVDHPNTNQQQSSDTRIQAQDRFVPHSNPGRQNIEAAQNSGSGQLMFPVPSYATLPKEVYSSNYDYQTHSKPSSNDPSATGAMEYPPDSESTFSKIPDSYAQPEIYGNDDSGDSPKFSGFPTSSSYGDTYRPKPADFPDHYESPSYASDPYFSHHEVIYDHPPDDHFHDYPKMTTTTEEPEMNDQRLSKRPYSYYYIGKKLWYLPLYFSIYFIIYIAALVLKSITRHKINFPASLAAVAADGRHSHMPYEIPGWYGLTKRVLDGIDLYNSIGKS
ncbi:uncharacterized protein [Venturia canescens]|uniref:uncharacterized protein n=1 Tax=Venturia canescens TaxID=32260 RepID=UPI001C9CA640|nr:uncharacterized protein LOC122417720 [Venturia canescens]